MVTAAKTTGSGHLLWPKDTNVETTSAEFVTCLNHTLTILSWYESCTSDELPPHWMWHLDWEIDEWFEIVRKKRDERFGTTSHVDDIDEDYEVNPQYDEWYEDLKNPYT